LDIELAVFFGLIVAYGAIAVGLGRFSVTMPVVFVAVGAVFGSRDVFNATSTEALTEATLALLLFADASTLSYNRVRHDVQLPGRLLLIALPLVMLLGGIVAYAMFPGEGLGFALLLGAILAPTDAALGLPVFSNPKVPVRIRRALNVESGLNDGIATPFVTLFLALTLAESSHHQATWLASALAEIAIGVGIGVAAGFLGGRLFATTEKRGWTGAAGEQIGNLALALCAFSAAKALGGNGFVAAFVGGLLFGHATRERMHVATEFTEITGTVLSLAIWTVFGANLAVKLFSPFDWLALVYALLSLTLIRMLPVAISLLRTRMRRDTILMMGWLGPRGLASIVFALMSFEAFREYGRPIETLAAAVGWTILLSVILHGLSAVPLANWYARRLATAEASAPELADLPELPAGRRHATGPPQPAG
jgi:NhaP-type Na+/H+ or K+/H+ antiporter